MHHASASVLIGTLLTSLALAQVAPPTPARLTMWPTSGNVAGFDNGTHPLKNPASVTPLVWDGKGDGPYPYADKYFVPNQGWIDFTPEMAAHDVAAALEADVAAGWTNAAHLAVFPRFVGTDLAGPAPTPDTYENVLAHNPDFDPLTHRGTPESSGWVTWRSFFYPNDRLPGLYDAPTSIPRPSDQFAFPGFTLLPTEDHARPGHWYWENDGSNRSYRHPFLINATQASPLKKYMQRWADQLANDMASSSALQNGDISFYFDVEVSHIIQTPTSYNSTYMLWYLTQAKVPGDDTLYIWDTFFVPGSPGWLAPLNSELFPGGTYTGFRSSAGMTLNQLYLAEANKRDPGGTDTTHWPRSRAALKVMLDNHIIPGSSATYPENNESRPVMLWWNEVCSKAEAQIWENAILGPLHVKFPNARFVNYQFTTVDNKVDESSTVHDLGALYPTQENATQTSYDAPLVEQLPRALYWPVQSGWLWKDGGPIGTDGTQRRWGFYPKTIQGTDGSVAEKVMDSPEFYFTDYASGYGFFGGETGTLNGHPTREFRGQRQENPSLPAWAQLSSTITTLPVTNDHNYFRYQEAVLFQNLLGFRHTAESSINSDHLTSIGTQQGQRQAAMIPWMWQELPSGVSEDQLVIEWTRRWSARIRSLMAMLRAKASPEWAVFMNPNSGNSAVQNGTLWYRSAQQRDEMFTSLVTDYAPLTGTIDEPSTNPHDRDRLNYTLRKVWGGNPTQRDYTVENVSTQPIVADPGHAAPPGRMTRTEVNVRLFPYPWLQTCTTFLGENTGSNLRSPMADPNVYGNPTSDPEPHPSQQLAGAYEINVESTAAVVTGTHADVDQNTYMMVEAYNYFTQTWDQLPLQALDEQAQPIFTAPMTNFQVTPVSNIPDLANAKTVKTRRTYLLKEPQYLQTTGGQTGILTAQYTQTISTIDESYSSMRLKVVQVAPGSSSLNSSLDLVQVIPLCAYDNYSDNVYVPRHTSVTDGSGEAQDAVLATVPHGATTNPTVGVHVDGAYPAIPDAGCRINPISGDPTFRGVDFSNPGPVFLSSAFCHTNPTGGGVSLTDSGGQPVVPATLFIELPNWVRLDTPGAESLFVWKYDSAVDPTDASLATQNPFAHMLSIEVRNSTQAGRASVIAVSGLISDNNSLMEGTYILHPNRGSGGLMIDSAVAPSEPVDDFEVRFSVLSDCNNNTIPDGCEIARQLDASGGSYLVDIFPTDGKLDQCHPDNCDPDYDANGVLDQGDVDALIGLIAGAPILEHPYADPDFNHDGVADQGDVNDLTNSIATGQCPIH